MKIAEEAMVHQELATNAVKYDALSAPAGRVTVRSHAMGAGRDAPLSVEWIERGGPAVVTPSRRSFGGRLLEEGLARELAGKVSLNDRPEGLVCRTELPPKALEPIE